MTARYFGLNTLAGAIRSATTVVEATTAGRFDSAYVANSVRVVNNGQPFDVSQPFWEGSTSLTGTIYLRCDVMFQNFTNNGDPVLLLLNSGANAYRLIGSAANTAQMQYWNSGTLAWVNWGSTFSVSNTTLYTMVLKLVVNSAFELRLGGSVVASSSTVPTNGASAVTLFRFGTPNSAAATDYSQIMCADYDIADSHMFSKLPSGNGNYTDGTGTASDVGETVLDDGTAIGLPSVGNKHTFTKGAAPSLPTGLTIAALGVNVRARVGGGTVTDGKIKIRSSSTDSTTSGKSFPSSYGPRGHLFTTDPNGGSNWTKTAFDNAEVGLEAA